MTARYRSPDGLKAALEHRLRERASGSGGELQRLRQLVVFERFLARVFTVFEDAVLKGALVLELRLDRARTTKDVDLRLCGSPERILAGLREAGRLDLGDYLVFEVGPDPRKPKIEVDGLPYAGYRYRAEARLAGKVYGAAFGVDVVLAEPLVGAPELMLGSSFLDFAGLAPPKLRVYPLEAQVAEKLHAYTLPRPRPNSRVKDLPDLALLASVRPIEADELRAAIAKTFANRATHEVPASVPAPPAAWEAIYRRLALSDALPWAELDDLLAAVRGFLDPALRGDGDRWNPSGWSWE